MRERSRLQTNPLPKARITAGRGVPPPPPARRRAADRATCNSLSVGVGGWWGVGGGSKRVRAGVSGHIRSGSPEEEQRRRLQTRRFTGSSSEEKKFCCLNRTGRGVLPRTCISHGCSSERNPPPSVGAVGSGSGSGGSEVQERPRLSSSGATGDRKRGRKCVVGGCHHHNNQVLVSTMPAE